MRTFLRCLKPINLAIVALTQILIYHFSFSHIGYHIEWVLSFPKILYFSLVTVLITASGYLINDYFDFENDKLNNKSNRLSNRTHYLIAYYSVTLIGFILALIFAISLAKPSLSLIYIVAVIILYIYSAVWKRKALIGNFIVALFSAFVILIILYAEQAGLSHLRTYNAHIVDELTAQFVFLAGFAFLISLAREIIKDIEDLKGDSLLHYETLPIKYGVDRAKMIVIFTLMFLLFTLGLWTLILDSSSPIIIILLIIIASPILWIIVNMVSRQPNLSYKHQSQLCKAVMICGLILFLIHPF